MTAPAEGRPSLDVLLRSLRLPTIASQYAKLETQAEKGGWSFQRYLHDLCWLEIEERRQRRIERNFKRASLPRDKTLATLDVSRLPTAVKRQLPTLCEGGFVERAENVLAFGLTGRGKTHTLAAIAHELVLRGHEVLFAPAYRLVQRLLAAKRDLRLGEELRRLDRFDVVVLDDIGYVQQDRDEMEVLFTLIAERYERRSIMLTSNLVFSQWERIFKDPMTTSCAIERLVHHSVILELTGSSYRTDKAKERRQKKGGA